MNPRCNRVLIVAAVALLPACSQETGTTDGTPAALVVPPDASGVSRTAGPRGRIAVQYELNEPYPANRVITMIEAALPDDNWTPQALQWLNPTLPTGNAKGWQRSLAEANGKTSNIDVWAGEWCDSTGNLMTYSLVYESPAESGQPARVEPTNSRLKVVALWAPFAEVALVRRVLPTGQNPNH